MSSHSLLPARRARVVGGFTLVELLVVIGIISVLVAILLPALNKAREAAQGISCLSRMRQIGMAVMMYTNEYGVYPRGANAAQNHATQWEVVLDKEYFGGTLSSGGYTPPPNAAKNIWACPGRIKPMRTPASYEGKWSGTGGYAINEYIGQISDTVWHKPTEISKPAEIPLILESTQWVLGYWSYHPGGAVAYRQNTRFDHSDGTNFIFADGHGEWIKERKGKWSNNWLGDPFPSSKMYWWGVPWQGNNDK